MQMRQWIYKIDNKDCLCIHEDMIEYERLECFFSVYPRRIIFIEDNSKKITGIISLTDFIKGLSDKKIYINRDFKKIILYTDYIVEVEKFFAETTYSFVPVLDEEKRLLEYWVRGNICREKLKKIPGKWLNIDNPYLAKIVKKRSYTKIWICMVDSLSEIVYDYFKNYRVYFNSVEIIQWGDIEKVKEDELLIMNDKCKIYADVKADICFISELQMELEFNLLLKHCKDIGCKLYLISELTPENITNLTQKERERVDKRDRYLGWLPYLMEREQHAELLEQVLGRKENMDEFIDSCLNYPLVIEKNQLCYLSEHTSKYCNVVQGNRVTIGIPEYITNTVYVAGNSFVFGPLVDDAHTISSFLQEKLILEEDMKNYMVINEGIRGASSYESIKRLNNDIFKENDIVILFVDLKEFLWSMGKTVEDFSLNIMEIYHLEDRFNALDRSEIKSYFIESPVHPNSYGYELTADYIMEIIKKEYDDSWKTSIIIDDEPLYEVYLDENMELQHYLEKIKIVIPKNTKEKVCGSIVMNCNPLTKGHKYLIEYAAKLVDYLYIFVVQEDKSMFSFDERFEMVYACAAEYSNTIILPSGSFIISGFTFPEYFTKQEADSDIVVDTSKDITIFGKYIAPALNITMRFAGEEPFDYVTAQYNRTMKQILPKYGIEFVEIPRYKKDDFGVITATRVREAIQEKDYEMLNALVPETTYRILKKTYFS